jgi:hypothetical protein
MSGNIYEKLQNARVTLQGMNLKKSGENKFAGYDYYELSDFMPAINDIFATSKMFSQVSFTTEIATLTIINTEKPDEQIVFTSPMASANLKGCHEIQNLGAVQSYQRRYLYMSALEIVEQDALDKTTGKEPTQKTANAHRSDSRTQTDQTHGKTSENQNSVLSDLISDAQKGMIAKVKRESGVTDDGYADILAGFGVTSTKDLKKSDASKVIKKLQEYGS